MRFPTQAERRLADLERRAKNHSSYNENVQAIIEKAKQNLNPDNQKKVLVDRLNS